MSTKFVSKNSNYMIVLKPGIEGNRAMGTHSVPGLYVKFEGGVVDVKDESIVALLRSHPDCGTAFIEIKPDEVDPYVDTRDEIEPMHNMTEIKYGHAEGKKISGKIKLSPQLKKIVEAEALKMLPDLLKKNPEVLKEIILGLASEMQAKETQKEDKTK